MRIRLNPAFIAGIFVFLAINLSFSPVAMAACYDAPLLLSPSDGTTTNDVTPQLQIQSVDEEPDCTLRATHWEIATDANFNNVVRSAMVDSGTKHSYIPLSLDVNQTYFWRAKVEVLVDGTIDESDWSSAWFFTVEGDEPPPSEEPPAEQPPTEQPPSQGGSNLKDYDMNDSCVLEDNEFFRAIDDWISQVIENGFFFDIVDAWIGQTDVCGAAASASIRISTQQADSGSIRFSVENLSSSILRLEVFNLQGNVIHEQSASGGSLIWNMRGAGGSVVANGVYLYRVIVRDAHGDIVTSEVRKMLVLR